MRIVAVYDHAMRSLDQSWGRPAILVVLHPGYTRDRSSPMPIDTELEPAEMEGRVLEAIELIRPALQSDGGDIMFDHLDGDGVVHVNLVGACGTCPISMQTLKAGVERIIMDRAPGVTAVVDDALVDEDPFA
jgi:Fe-S cluster biogenesis protein NfuA